ncbi:hypothetical protein [Lactiplantibacillus carotarum]|uniref:hypothetical protein n=1 Tax=Lactiplantibacillus carotarum TaxID=2993456 RepID=UPI00298F08F0|nr:hypothetical protein [Lactiplantibacillus carotarum]
MHLAYARRVTIYYKNPASSGSAVRTETFEVTKHSDGSLDMENIPLYGFNVPDNLGTQGANYLKTFEMSMHFYTDHLYIRHNNTISMAPDWNAAVVHKNDTNASMIHILRVEGNFNDKCMDLLRT